VSGSEGRLRDAMARVGEPCAPGPKPRKVPRTHPLAREIRAVASEVRALVTRARAASREYLVSIGRGGGADLAISYNASARTALDARGEMGGFPLVGLGSERAVYRLPHGEVVKVGTDEGGDAQCRKEAARWRNAPEAVAMLLCPVLAAGEGWVVMPFAGPAWVSTLAGADRVTWDVRQENLGSHCGRVVLVDYGV